MDCSFLQRVLAVRRGGEKSDTLSMGIKDYISMSIAVLKDFRVIITMVVMIIVIEFAKYIASYRKKTRRPKVKKGKVKAPKAAAPAEAPAEEEAAAE